MVGSFSNWIESVSLRVGWWLAVFQMGFHARLLYQWLGNGWQFFILNRERIFKGWMMVGCFSNEVQCSNTFSMVGQWLAVFQIQLRAYLQGLDDGWLFSRWGSVLYYFLNGWVMVGSFSNLIESLSVRVGWWLAVFQKRVQCFFTSSMVGPWLAVFQYICNAYLKWLDGGWQIFIYDLVHDEL